METQEIKQRIKDYFVEIKEDKFTKVKSIKCKQKIEWKGKDLENKFMLTKDSYSNSLSMSIDYRHKDDTDSVFLGFTYSNSAGGYPGMTNIIMYLILDDDKTIELSDSSGFDHVSQSSRIGDNYITVYLETAQLAVSMSDFIAIANAKKIEYSIRFGQGSLEKIISEDQLFILKGFYNAAFDEEFELEYFQNSNLFKTSASLSEIEVFIELLYQNQKNNLIKANELGFIYRTKSNFISFGKTAIKIKSKGLFGSTYSISWQGIQDIYNRNHPKYSNGNFEFSDADKIIIKEIIKFSKSQFPKNYQIV
jgi:hypothetical protein